MDDDSRLYRALRAGTSQPGDIERVVQCLRDAGFAITRNPDPNEEVIWATSMTGDDFRCVHADDWRIAQVRIAELEAALRKIVEHSKMTPPDWMYASIEEAAKMVKK